MGRRDFRIASLSGLLPSAENASPSVRIFGTSGTDPVCPYPRQNKKQATPSEQPVFWLGRRDSDPRDAGVKVLCLTAWRRPNMLIVKTPTAFNYGRINFKWGGGWDSNPRSSEPQSDALGQLRYIHHVRQFQKTVWRAVRDSNPRPSA